VLAVDHLEELGYLISSSTDCSINFWDLDDWSLKQRLPVPVPQLTMEWHPTGGNLESESNGILFTGGVMNPKTGKVTISGYDPLSFKTMAQMNMHTDAILDLHSIPSLHTLVSCGMDSKICLWDLHTQQHKKTLLGHTKGVMDIDYSPDHRILASAGFDHDVLVWNPHVENIICRLMGHTAALIGVKMSERCELRAASCELRRRRRQNISSLTHSANLASLRSAPLRSPEILSASCDGVIKVWDIRNFKCSQTIYCETSQPLSDFSYFEGDTSGCMVIASKRTLHLFENEPDEDPRITDTNISMEILFQKSTCR